MKKLGVFTKSRSRSPIIGLKGVENQRLAERAKEAEGLGKRAMLPPKLHPNQTEEGALMASYIRWLYENGSKPTAIYKRLGCPKNLIEAVLRRGAYVNSDPIEPPPKD